jgi:hypothetical protein
MRTRPLIALAGTRHGYWRVLALSQRRPGGKSLWLCVCDCGVERIVRGDTLRSGISGSCGCRLRERTRARLTIHGHTRYGKKKKRSRLYAAWVSMRQRCNNPRSQGYHNYGGRGIRVYPRWDTSSARFLSDILSEIGWPPKGKSLDRIDNDGNYEPGNVRWANPLTQTLNRRPPSLWQPPPASVGRFGFAWIGD